MKNSLRDELRERNDGYAMGIFILFFLGVAYLITDAYNWKIGALVFVLLCTVWELAYRLATRVPRR